MNKVIQFYDNYDEDGRLFRDNAHMIEYFTTIHYFDLLFKPHSRILDVCAGTGRYSFYLADKGHYVTACDLVQHNVDVMKSKPNANKLIDISVCNVLDLSRFDENSFDVVLCMGALYHLGSSDLNEKAVSECTHVCKPGGIIVLSYVQKRPENLENIFFCLTPYEIEQLTAKCGLERKHNICTGGIFHNNENNSINDANDQEFQKYMEHHYLTCENKSVIEEGNSGLWIGIKVQ